METKEPGSIEPGSCCEIKRARDRSLVARCGQVSSLSVSAVYFSLLVGNGIQTDAGGGQATVDDASTASLVSEGDLHFSAYAGTGEQLHGNAVDQLLQRYVG